MKRTLIALPDELLDELERFRLSRNPPQEMMSVVESAVREYLRDHNVKPPARPLRITPATRGSGHSDVSVNHDRYFSE
jgi:hypothetical protein